MKPSPDAAVTSSSQDRLGRLPLTSAIASAICNWSTPESLVIAIYGAWGSGKTSVKNLVLERLAKQRKNGVTVIEFNPWMVTKQEQLAENFFRDLAVAILRSSPNEKPEQSKNRLAKFASYLKVAGSVSEHALKALSLAGFPGAEIGATVVKTINATASMTKDAAEAQKQVAEASHLTLADLKSEVRDSLEKQERPVLVVIDDVDRLARDEICLLFRLIKANADFPRFVFLVLCDRQFVTEALEDLAPKRGAEFLEKIVQVSFELPQPPWSALIEIAAAECSGVLRTSKDASKRANPERWHELMDLAKPLLRQVRSVRRWMNAVQFSFGFFRKRGVFDANPEDIFGIELLRIFEPTLYQKLSTSKKLLIRDEWDVEIWLARKNNDTGKFKDELFSTVLTERRGQAEAIVDWLFPHSAWSFDRSNPPSLLKDLRVASAECFDRYFAFALSTSVLSRRALKDILQASKNKDALSKILLLEQCAGRLPIVLDHLTAHVDELLPHSNVMLHTFFGLGDRLTNEGWVLGGAGPQGAAVTFLRHLLRRIEKQEDRTRVLVDEIKSAAGIMLPFHVCWYETNESYREHHQDELRIVADRDLPLLKAAIVAKIEEFSSSPIMVEADQVGFVLYEWFQWGGPDGPAKWIRRQLVTPSKVWQILRSCVNSETSGGKITYTGMSRYLLDPLDVCPDIERVLAVFEGQTLIEDHAELLRLYRDTFGPTEEEANVI